MLCTKILIIEENTFDQNCRNNGECNNTKILGRKKNANMAREKIKLEATIIEWEL